MVFKNRNFEWYSARSKTGKVSPRCPIASSDLCPRYYSSLWLLGKNKVTTSIPEHEKARLDKKWAPFKPTVVEEEAEVAFREGELRGISEFCPEVSYMVFGFFASGLHRYADEIDVDHAHQRLGRDGADASDPRWAWASITPRHFMECREYSIFIEISAGKQRRRGSIRRGLSPKVRWQVFSRDSFICRYCGRKPPEAALEVDHQISIAHGGTDDSDNLHRLCGMQPWKEYREC